jgi:hypothetical protein
LPALLIRGFLMRRIGIVVLNRRLAVALWRYADQGRLNQAEDPESQRVTNSIPTAPDAHPDANSIVFVEGARSIDGCNTRGKVCGIQVRTQLPRIKVKAHGAN